MKTENKDNFKLIYNENGPILGVSAKGNVPILEVDGCYFKNLSRSGKLEFYEDWRLDAKTRAQDLASKLSIEQIAGLMLYSKHQPIPGRGGPFGGTYNGKPFDEANVPAYTMSDEQKQFLKEDNVRHVLVTSMDSKEVGAKWNNLVQEYVEGLPWGIPVNNSSDPRHKSKPEDVYHQGQEYNNVSKWPDGIGIAATFDPDIAYEFGQVVSKESRALGIGTALFPQIDLATEPRWNRFNQTFSEDAQLSIDLSQAYVDGLQTSTDNEIADGWGYDSINAMVKHFPGGATGEAGRDAHYIYGKYSVYPGNNFKEHLRPFKEGAFNLKGKTKCAASVMPYYTVSTDIDQKNGENVGNSYSKYIITDILRNECGFDGVVCTDWGITRDESDKVYTFMGGKCWGVEHLSEAQRHYKILMAGADQFGGNNDMKPIIEAYEIGVQEHGQPYMRRRFEQSATRLLMNFFRLGLFENPYLDIDKTNEIVGCKEHVEKGYEVQKKSLTLLKNKNHVLPIKDRLKVYIPTRHIEPHMTPFAGMTQPMDVIPCKKEIVEQYYDVVDNPHDADFALVFMETPINDPYSLEDKANGGNGYMPISLQYRPYTASKARKISIAGGDPNEDTTNRSYYGKTNTTANESDLDNVIEMKKIMGNKPVIVSICIKNPVVMAEFEPYADAIIADYSVSNNAILDLIKGEFEPSGLLPLQIPKDMDEVECQLEDVPFDMIPYTDSEGHIYDFAYGMNFEGVIDDKRVKKYKH